MFKSLYITFLFLLFSNIILAQCTSPDSTKITIYVTTDSFPNETGWTLFGLHGAQYDIKPPFTYQNSYFKTFKYNYCVSKDECMKFTLIDKDGIAKPGGVKILVKNDTVASVNFGDKVDVSYFNCKSGETCGTPQVISTGIHTNIYDSHYYAFTPPQDGFYKISTCDSINNCDTKIWIYEECKTFNPLDNKLGTILFNNDSNCGLKAEIPQAVFDKTRTYIIRIGGDNCAGKKLKMELAYLGPVKGCRDTASCNYNYLATEDGEKCIPQNSTDCKGPDLTISADAIVQSLIWGKVNADLDPCMINEGCLKGFGMRDVLRFATLISNVGDQDYFIGKVTANPTQFVWDACHQHYHYKGYAEYLLYNELGQKIPIGFKSGFCVTDFECIDDGQMKYSCTNMGLSIGCTDIYERDLPCQWVDFTDVPSGKYTMVARVNWDNSPDRLGRKESRTDNNWAQVCLEIKRSNDSIWYVLDPNCPTWKDCLGVPYGNTNLDCEGKCGGKAVSGDLDNNSVADLQDIKQYVQASINNSLTPTMCNDLNVDGRISVTDASLLASCLAYGRLHEHFGAGGTHDHCIFPVKVNNTQDTVYFSMQNYNPMGKYFDVAIRNNSKEVNAYQFKMNNVQIVKAINLIDSTKYNAKIYTTLNKGTVIGLSYQDSVILKSPTKKSLLRIYFANNATINACIDEVSDVTDGNGYSLVAKVEGGCLKVSSDKEPILMNLNPVVYPHPITQEATLSFYNPESEMFTLEIYDISGKLVQKQNNIRSNEITIQRQHLANGFYVYKLRGENGFASGKLIFE